MKAEEILKSHWLDILFENRNKEFGAYTIRRHYNERMLKAVASALGLTVLIFLLLHSVKTNKGSAVLVDVTDVDISRAYPTPKPPEKLPEPVQKTPPPVKTVAFTVPDFQKHVKPEINSPYDDPYAAISNITNPVGQPVGITQPPVTPPATPDPGPVTTPAPQPVINDEPVRIAEEMPAFPGGREQLVAFLQKHLQDYVTEEGQVKKAVVYFVVEKDGSLTSIEITEGDDSDFNKRVIRTIEKMPRWTPGSQNGHKVKVLYAFPIQLIPAED